MREEILMIDSLFDGVGMPKVDCNSVESNGACHIPQKSEHDSS